MQRTLTHYMASHTYVTNTHYPSSTNITLQLSLPQFLHILHSCTLQCSSVHVPPPIKETPLEQNTLMKEGSHILSLMPGSKVTLHFSPTTAYQSLKTTASRLLLACFCARSGSSTCCWFNSASLTGAQII